MSVFICTVICNHCNPAKIRLCFKTEYKISDDGAKIIIIKWNKKKKKEKRQQVALQTRCTEAIQIHHTFAKPTSCISQPFIRDIIFRQIEQTLKYIKP